MNSKTFYKNPPPAELSLGKKPEGRAALAPAGRSLKTFQIWWGRGDLCTGAARKESCVVSHQDHRGGRQAGPLPPLGQLGLGRWGQLQTA